MSALDWRPFLETWSRELIAAGATSDASPEALASGWLGSPGATDAQLADAEARLGTTLPPSYREFLRVTNGWGSTGTFIWRVWSAAEIGWFRTSHQDWIDAYVRPLGALGRLLKPVPSVADEAYFVYGEAQDSVHFRPEYLESALQISDVGDSAVYLLNPRIVADDGEWEAWFFANWLPGATRYRSFAELMRGEYRSFRDLLRG